MGHENTSAAEPPTLNLRGPGGALPFAWCCMVCRRYEPFGYDLLKRFADEGWPVCCAEVVLAVAVRAPGRGEGALPAVARV